ncbi:FbpB family small basic protein [Bacillus sp. FSL H8-0547]
MRKMKKMTFEELVFENKKELMKDQEALDKLEERVEQRLLDKLS